MKVNKHARSGSDSRMGHQENEKPLDRVVFCFQLSVPCGTLSAPLVREEMLRIVKYLRIVVAHLTSHCAKHNASLCFRHSFTWRSQTSLLTMGDLICQKVN